MIKRLTGIRLIAQRAGVHVSTVSRALNPKTRTRLSHEVATRILKIASDLSYTRNPLAVGLKTRRSFTVGVIVPDLTNPLFPPIVRAVERTLGKEGYVTMLADSDNSREMESAILDSLRARQVDGLILATAWLHDDIVTRCREQNTPLVLVNRTVLASLSLTFSSSGTANWRTLAARSTHRQQRDGARGSSPRSRLTG